MGRSGLTMPCCWWLIQLVGKFVWVRGWGEGKIQVRIPIGCCGVTLH